MRPHLDGDPRLLQLPEPGLHCFPRRLHPALLDDLSLIVQEAALAPFISQIYPHRQFCLPASHLQRVSTCIFFPVLVILFHGWLLFCTF